MNAPLLSVKHRLDPGGGDGNNENAFTAASPGDILMQGMRRTAIYILFSAAALAGILHAVGAAETKWEKNGVKDGVTLYTTRVEGSDVVQVKAVTVVDAPAEEVWEFLPQVETLVEFLVANEKLGDCGESCAYFYQRLHHPLIKDRHYVLKTQWKTWECNGAKVYKRWWQQTDEKSTRGADAVLVKRVSGQWIVRPTKDGSKTRLQLINHIDMGGLVPVLLLNTGVISNTYKLLKKIRKAL
jgi:uncharacterized protein (DUF2235 family)